MSTVLNIGDLSERTEEQAVADVRHAGPEFVLEVPLPHVNHSQSRLGPALDFLRGPEFGGTEECTIIDFADNIRRLGPPLAYAQFADFWTDEETEGE